ncbi:MAG TPA: hypothetical protein VG433_11215 [Pirellulales bacterium]|jgi:hypothetical protein|nr:hypothetical protein [Pirellulales bacterium]
MAMLLPILLFVLLILIVGLLYPTGLWGNAINLINVVTAALLATNFWEPVAGAIKSAMPSLVYLVDIFVLWLLFALFAFGLRFATDAVSKYKVRFPKPVELGGNVLFALWTAWVVICFGTMTLHTAPLAREFMGGGFRPEQPTFFGFSPDRLWLGFVQKESEGAFARGGDHIFDPQSEFMLKYAERRSQFEHGSGLFAADPNAKPAARAN